MIDTQTTSWFKDASQQTRKKKKEKFCLFVLSIVSSPKHINSKWIRMTNEVIRLTANQITLPTKPNYGYIIIISEYEICFCCICTEFLSWVFQVIIDAVKLIINKTKMDITTLSLVNKYQNTILEGHYLLPTIPVCLWHLKLQKVFSQKDLIFLQM